MKLVFKRNIECKIYRYWTDLDIFRHLSLSIGSDALGSNILYIWLKDDIDVSRLLRTRRFFDFIGYEI